MFILHKKNNQIKKLHKTTLKNQVVSQGNNRGTLKNHLLSTGCPEIHALSHQDRTRYLWLFIPLQEHGLPKGQTTFRRGRANSTKF
jgi:hypothetical protein